MIQWTVATSGVGALTGSSVFSSSTSYSSSFSNTIRITNDTGTNTTLTGQLSASLVSDSGSTSSASTEYRSTSYGATATTTYSSSSSESASASASGRTIQAVGTSPDVTGGGNSGSDSQSTVLSEVWFKPAENIQTTTQITVPYFDTSLYSGINGEGQTAWGVTYVETAVAQTVVTNLENTSVAEDSATVYQAEANEVLYVIQDLPTQWMGYDAATAAAQSATRATITPSVATTNLPPVDESLTTSASLANSSVTTLVNYSSLAATNFVPATLVLYTRLPNQTFSQNNGISYGTRTASLSQQVFFSNNVSYGKVSNQWRTTSQVKSWTLVSTKVPRRFGPFVHEALVGTTVSQNRTITLPLITTGSKSGATSSETVTSFTGANATTNQTNKRDSASGSSFFAGNNQTVYGDAQVSTGVASPAGRTRFATSGAIINNQTGLWFTANSGTITDRPGFPLIVASGSGRVGRVLFPHNNSTLTISNDSVTWSKTQSRAPDSENSATSEWTTASMTVGVSGSSITVVDTMTRPYNVATWRISHNGGGMVAPGGTIVDVAGPGAYKDRIAGVTTSFSGAATVVTEGMAETIRSWVPIPHLSPPSLRTNRNGVVFAVARNDVNLPPGRRFAGGPILEN